MRPSPKHGETSPSSAPWTDEVSAEGISILDSIELPLVVVARDCRLARFNRAAAEVFGLRPADIGRLPCNTVALAEVRGLERECAQVIAEGLPRLREVRFGDRLFVYRISPYTEGDGHTIGAVLTFTNVTAFRESVGRAIYEREHAKSILNTVADALIVLDADLRVQTGNRAFYSLFGVLREAVHHVPLCDLGDDEWKNAPLWTALKAILVNHHHFQSVEIERAFASGRRTILLDAHRLSQLGDARGLLLLSFHDITERKRSETLRAEQNRLLELIAKGTPAADCMLALTAAVSRLHGGVRAGVITANSQRDALSRVYAADLDPAFARAIEGLPIDENLIGACGAAIFNGRSILCSDITDDKVFPPIWRGHCLAHGIKACLSTPVFGQEDKAVASFALFFSEAHEPDAWELQIAEFGAHVTGFALARERSARIMRDDAAWLMAQKEAFACAMLDHPLAESLRPLIEMAVQHFAGEARAAIYLADDENGTLSHITGMTEAYAEAVKGFKIGGDTVACGLAVHRGQPVITPDIFNESAWESWQHLGRTHNYRACWSFPLRAADGPVMGTLAFYFAQKRHATTRDMELAGALATTAAIITSRHQQAVQRTRAVAALR